MACLPPRAQHSSECRRRQIVGFDDGQTQDEATLRFHGLLSPEELSKSPFTIRENTVKEELLST